MRVYPPYSLSPESASIDKLKNFGVTGRQCRRQCAQCCKDSRAAPQSAAREFAGNKRMHHNAFSREQFF